VRACAALVALERETQSRYRASLLPAPAELMALVWRAFEGRASSPHTSFPLATPSAPLAIVLDATDSGALDDEEMALERLQRKTCSTAALASGPLLAEALAANPLAMCEGAGRRVFVATGAHFRCTLWPLAPLPRSSTAAAHCLHTVYTPHGAHASCSHHSSSVPGPLSAATKEISLQRGTRDMPKSLGTERRRAEAKRKRERAMRDTHPHVSKEMSSVRQGSLGPLCRNGGHTVCASLLQWPVCSVRGQVFCVAH
jgi:hypothetical protein